MTFRSPQLYIALCVFYFTLIACKKNDTPAPQETGRISSIEISFDDGYDTIHFDYDAYGRVIRVGNESFTYGANGKVASSRLHAQSQTAAWSYELIKQCSYRWDDQDRLEMVTLDSLYIKKISQGNEITPIIDIHLTKNIPIAKLEYSGVNSKPSKVHYRYVDTRIPEPNVLSGSPIDIERTKTYNYDGANIKYYQARELVARVDSFDPPFLVWREGYSFYKYTDKPHYLSKVYDQMGFNPLEIYVIIPAQQEECDITIEADKTDLNTYVPDWLTANRYHVIYNELDLPTELTVPRKNLGDGLISFETHIRIKYNQ